MIRNDDKLVSVIMCVYNTQQDYLIEAANSILNQTYKNFEFLIVDDCSKEDLFTDDIFKDKRITILRNKENHGPSYSRNKALQIAKGEYVAIMDSDDISYPNRFEKQVEFLEENQNVVACGTWFKYFGIKNHEVKLKIDDNEFYRCCLLFNNAPTLLNPSVMLRRKTLIDNNILWKDELRLGEDYLMWVQLSEIGIVTNLKEVLINYRTHESQATASKNRKKINSNTWIIQKYQLDRVGITLSENDYRILPNMKADSIKELARINNIINSIVDANKKTKYFDIGSLEKRCNEQIKMLVFSTNNPLRLLCLVLNKSFSKYAKEAISHKIKKLLKINSSH